MWKVSAVIIFLIVAVIGGVFAFPHAVTTMITDSLRARTGAEDVQLSIIDSPRLIFGEIGAIDGVMRQGRIGKLFVRELTVSGTNLRFDMGALLSERNVVITEAESVEMRGVIDADAIRGLISNEADKFSDVAVTVHPDRILATAKTRAFGQTFEVTMEGGFSIMNGDLYYKANRITARGMGLNVLSLDGLFPDVLVARADALPLGLTFETVEAEDGIVVLTAGK